MSLTNPSGVGHLENVRESSRPGLTLPGTDSESSARSVDRGREDCSCTHLTGRDLIGA
jgi:hypothetical protein